MCETMQIAVNSVINCSFFPLYRARSNKQNQTTKQLAVPTGLRQRVMTLAHAGVMSGHQGVYRTLERVSKNFWWPGMSNDVNLFCHSFGICQRTVKKGRIPEVPLRKMLIIDTPFKRVAVDLVREIFPPSSWGHRYILTVVDYAIRYPVAVPLKYIHEHSCRGSCRYLFQGRNTSRNPLWPRNAAH